MNTSRKILIVDDDFTTRKLLSKYIRKNCPCVVLHAEDGSQALRIMIKEHPQVVVLDLIMPFMNGLEVLKTMRSNSQLANIPVIVCTAVDDDKIVKEIIQYGIIDYIIKPIKEEIFLQKILKILTG